jgi:hypothetical protein
MRIYRNAFSAVALIAAFVLGSAGFVSAQQRNERDVRDAVRSINSKLDDFESTLRFQMQSSSVNNGSIDQVSDEIADMRDAVRRFEDNLNRRRENGADVDQIVNVAASINEFLIANPQNRQVTDTWQQLRRQLDRLASNYGVTNDWDRTNNNNSGSYNRNSQIDPPDYDPQPARNYPSQNTPPVLSDTFTVGLSGTYSLDRQRSENVDDVVSSAGVNGADREDLKEKLDAPDQIAIDVRGSQITVATSTSSPVVFTADGREKVENIGGRTVRNRATLGGDKIVVSSIGGETDYTITFTSVNNGQGLKVSRRITTDYLNQTVFADSVYTKTDSVARLGIPTNGGNNTSSNDTYIPPTSGGNNNNTSTYDPNAGYSDNDQGTATVANGGTGTNNGTYNPRPNNTGRPAAVYAKPGNYIVPDGSMITGILENEINTSVSQNNDRFRMTVQSPNEFRGAVIEGYISNIQRSGKVTGTAAVTLNFERIRMRDGRTYDFAGTLRTAADTTGKTSRVDNEGTVRGDNQTTNTAKRGGIGAGIGALIGAIAGGGKGAAIGAILGGGAGAGSVYIQDRKDVRLMQGSTLTIQAAAPAQLSR